jgi:putative copper resistance protein D
MQWLIEIYGFLAVLVRGTALTFEATTVGGVIFLTLCLHRERAPQRYDACVRFLRWSSILLSGTLVFAIALTALVLHNSAEDFTWADALRTTYSLSGLIAGISAVAIAGTALRVHARNQLLPAGFIVAAALMGSHAFARVDQRPLLLIVTALHHLAVAAWIGGLPYLLIAWIRAGDKQAAPLGRRFSRLAMVSVFMLCATGLAMSQKYVGEMSAVYGASYGLMLVAKVMLLGLLLLLGASNFRLLRRPADPLGYLKMLRSVEVEAAVGIITILAAASLTSQPPAVDLVERRVPAHEIVERFTPRWPRLQTPPLSALSPATPLNQTEASATGLALPYVPGSAYQPNTAADIAWSEYNHNWAGLCVLLMGVLAVLSQSGWVRWARHWPLAFLGLAIFLLIRADSENWPLGPGGFWESFQVADVAQHRLFVLLIVFFAFFEWQVAAGRSTRDWQPLVFPAICLTGGALLLTHTHPLGNVKEALLAELSHSSIALLAVTAAAARWLQLRLPRPPIVLGLAWPACFVAIGLLLTFYRES